MNNIQYEKLGESLYYAQTKGGLKVFVIPKKGFNKTYAQLATNYGSIDNAFKIGDKIINIPDGTAHFLEHKMFEQKDGGNAFDLFGKYGASANAFTSFDITAYLFDCQNNYEIMLKHLLSYVYEPYYTEDNIAKEQGIIGQEINMYADDPDWVTFFNLIRGLYKDYTVNIDIAGSAESIATITPELLYSIHSNFYHPSNMILCVAGNCDPDTVFAIAENTTPTTPLPKIERIVPYEEMTVAKKEINAKMSVAGPVYYIGFKEQPSEDPGKQYNVLGVMLEILFGKASEFYTNLMDLGKATSFSKGIETGRGFTFIGLSGESQFPYDVNKLCLDEIKRRKEVLFTDKELDCAKKMLYGNFVRSLDSVESISSGIISSEFHGFNYFKNGLAILDVTRKDVETAIAECFNNNSLSVTLPKEE